MTPRTRTRSAFALALLLHATVIATMPHARRAPADHSGAPIELDVTTEREPPVTSVVPPVAPDVPPSHEPARATSRVARSDTRPPPAATPSEPSEPLVAPPAASGETWSFSPIAPRSNGAPGTLGGDALARATAAGVAAVVDEATKKAQRPRKPWLSPAEVQREIDLGLAPGGAYVSLARDRVMSSVAPMNGHALLEFSTNDKGIVLRVRVLDVSSDRRAWDEVAASLEEDSRTAFPLRIPDGAAGLVITIDVKSELRGISGASASQSTLARVAGAIMDPADALMDSKGTARRVVSARIVNVVTY